MSDNRKFVQSQTFILAGSGASIGATSITLVSFAQIDGTLLTMTNFGTKGFMTLEPNNSTKEEAITFTGVTQNVNGTATLTGVSTQLFISPYTETSGTTKLHAGGTKAIVTNTAGFYDQFTNKEDDEVIDGLWTFSQFPVKSGSLINVGVDELASYQTVLNVAGGLATIDQLMTTGTAGEAITAGKVVYLRGSDTLWLTADSSDVTKSVAVKLGIAQAAAGGSGSSILVLTGGITKNQSGLTGTTPYYLSTAGGISTTKGANIRLVGRAQSATALQFEDDEQSTEVQLVDGSRTYAISMGNNGSFVLALTPAITAYKQGQVISFLSGTNSIAGTNYINVNSLGAKVIKKLGNTTNLAVNDIRGSSVVVLEYDNTGFQMVSPVAVAPIATTDRKFGGTGSDGALTLLSGTTTLNLSSAAVTVKNYSSISLTGTAAYAFSSPASNGSIVIWKCSGDVTLTSSANPMIDLRSLGSAGGAAGGGADNNVGGIGGGGGGGASLLATGATGGGGSLGGASGGGAGTPSVFGNGLLFSTGAALGGSGGGSTYVAATDGTPGTKAATTYSIFSKAISLAVGTGGGGGGGSGDNSVNGGAGGAGAGALYIECAGTLNITGVINAAGTAGASAVGATAGSGGGGGGGSVIILYNTVGTSTPTITVTGGSHGAVGTGAGDGATGYSLVALNSEYL